MTSIIIAIHAKVSTWHAGTFSTDVGLFLTNEYASIPAYPVTQLHAIFLSHLDGEVSKPWSMFHIDDASYLAIRGHSGSIFGKHGSNPSTSVAEKARLCLHSHESDVQGGRKSTEQWSTRLGNAQTKERGEWGMNSRTYTERPCGQDSWCWREAVWRCAGGPQRVWRHSHKFRSVAASAGSKLTEYSGTPRDDGGKYISFLGHTRGFRDELEVQMSSAVVNKLSRGLNYRKLNVTNYT